MNGVAIYRAENDGEDFVFVDFNKYAESIDNVKKDDLVGKSVLKMFPSIKDFGLFDVFKRVWKTGRPEEHPVALYKDERISVWRDNFVYRLPSGEIVSVYNDVTSRKQAEEELERSQDQLRSFTDHIQDIREDERANIAHEIHDEMGQALTGLNMDLSWLAKKVPGDREELLEKIRAMSGLVSAIHKNRTADHRGSETGAPG